jgi:membrane protein implicated in regulation of membrane protease activity
VIKIHPGLYRALWITCAVLCTILIASPLMLISPDVRAQNAGALQTQLIAFAILGVFALAYSIWRLVKPLKPPPSE